MKYCITLMVFQSFFIFLNAQSFTGKLTYSYETNEDPEFELFLEDYGVDDYSRFSIIEVIIDTNRLTSISTRPSGKWKSVLYQEGDIATTVLDGFYMPFKSIYPNGIDYKFIKQTNKFDVILDVKCKKYFYKWGNTDIEAWIPEGYNYPDSFANGVFFRKYFFEQGIAFKIRYSYKTSNKVVINTFILESIEID